MPDLTTAVELETLLGVSFDSDDEVRADLLLDLVEAEVQGVVHYGLTEVADDVVELEGNWTGALQLPRGPVSAVSAVEVDGTVVTDWTLVGDRLLRRRATDASTSGWWAGPDVAVEVTYSHGYPSSHWRVQAARPVVLRAAIRAWSNPEMRQSVRLGPDYQTQFADQGGGTVFLTEGDLKMLDRAGLRVKVGR